MSDIVGRLRMHYQCWDEAAAEIERLQREANGYALKVYDLREALETIMEWARAYPLKVFPEPDFKKAAAVLNAEGMTLDAISASCMRHVVTEVGEIARRALEEK